MGGRRVDRGSAVVTNDRARASRRRDESLGTVVGLDVCRKSAVKFNESSSYFILEIK